MQIPKLSRAVSAVVLLLIGALAIGSSASPAGADVEAAGEYHAVGATRILDTRSAGGPLGQSAVRDVQITGVAGVPATGVDSVVLNVTATGATGNTFVTVWPKGAARPTASSINLAQGSTVPNLVTVRVGTGGQVSIFNNAGQVNIIVDVFGYYGTTAATEGARYGPGQPLRLADTRTGIRPLNPGEVLNVGLTNPFTEAVMMNVTVTSPTSSGFLTVYDGDSARPNVSNLNFEAGQEVANAVLVTQGKNPANCGPTSVQGCIKIYNSSGRTHVIVDVVGRFTTRAQGGLTYVSLAAPTRVVDTRTGVGGKLGGFSPNESFLPTIGGTGGVSALAEAIVGNITVTNTSSSGFMTLWSSNLSRPTSSSVNWSPRGTVANSTTVSLGADNKIGMFSNAWADAILDVSGYFA